MPIGTDTLAAILAALTARLDTVDGLTVYDHEPASVDQLPAATIRLQELQRQPVELAQERAESQLGSVDLYLAWTVIVYTSGDYARQSDLDALDTLGRVVGAIDADETLGNTVLSASVATATRERVTATRDGRELLTYVVTVTTTSLH